MTDFQSMIDHMGAMSCVVSVETLEDGRTGKFRIVAGNKAYVDSIEHPAPGTEMLTNKFTPNSEYTDYLTRDLNFEDACYQAAVLKKCLHSYAHPDRMPVWFNMSFLPVFPDEGNLHYCIYMMEINQTADSRNLSTISGDLASAILETSIKLRGTTDFPEAMKEVIGDIRDLCDAEFCAEEQEPGIAVCILQRRGVCPGRDRDLIGLSLIPEIDHQFHIRTLFQCIQGR